MVVLPISSHAYHTDQSNRKDLTSLAIVPLSPDQFSDLTFIAELNHLLPSHEEHCTDAGLDQQIVETSSLPTAAAAALAVPSLQEVSTAEN